MWFVYIIQSEKSKKIYIGLTNNLQERLKKHNQQKSFSTKRDIPWQIVYYEAYQSIKDATLREKRLKYYGKALAQLRKRIIHSLS